MGLSIPPLPKLFKTSKSKKVDKFLCGLPQKPLVDYSKQNIPVPDWVDKYDGFNLTSYKHGFTINGRKTVTVAIYWDSNMTSGFARIYLIDDDGNPYANTDKILKEMEYREGVQPVGYWVVDGKFYRFQDRPKELLPPSEIEIRDISISMTNMKESWEQFPMAPDYDTVQKLEQAQYDVSAMLSEEKHGFARKHMEGIREQISGLQSQLEQIDKNLNVMYEKAADGMNLLEQYGISVNLDDEPKEPEKIAVDCDISSLYPNSILKYIGAATIRRMPGGSYNVTPKDLKYNPNSGDMVHDTGNGLTAVYSYGKWEVMNP